jgi:hypothetical protein
VRRQLNRPGGTEGGRVSVEGQAWRLSGRGDTGQAPAHGCRVGECRAVEREPQIIWERGRAGRMKVVREMRRLYIAGHNGEVGVECIGRLLARKMEQRLGDGSHESSTADR